MMLKITQNASPRYIVASDTYSGSYNGRGCPFKHEIRKFHNRGGRLHHTRTSYKWCVCKACRTRTHEGPPVSRRVSNMDLVPYIVRYQLRTKKSEGVRYAVKRYTKSPCGAE